MRPLVAPLGTIAHTCIDELTPHFVASACPKRRPPLASSREVVRESVKVSTTFVPTAPLAGAKLAIAGLTETMLPLGAPRGRGERECEQRRNGGGPRRTHAED